MNRIGSWTGEERGLPVWGPGKSPTRVGVQGRGVPVLGLREEAYLCGVQRRGVPVSGRGKRRTCVGSREEAYLCGVQGRGVPVWGPGDVGRVAVREEEVEGGQAVDGEVHLADRQAVQLKLHLEVTHGLRQRF